MFGLCQFLINLYFLAYEMDKTSRYKPGNVKRQEKQVRAENIRSLPKITQWIQLQSVSEPEESQSHSDASVTTEKNFTTDMNQQLPTNSCASNDVQPEAVVLHEFENDLGLWPKKLDESMRSFWIERGSSDCRHNDGDFKESSVKEADRTRHCTKLLFTRKHALSGEEIDVTWLCYSKNTGRVYCFVCKLMSINESSFKTGFNDWKHARNSIESHGRSEQHRKSMADLAIRKSVDGRIDASYVKQYETDCRYCRQVLQRCVDVLKFICERGLAIRGKDSLIGSVHNGNYLGLLELLSIYDSYLVAHISKHANQGSGHISYLSHFICEELIELMADKVLSTIINEVQNAKFFSISVDSTPDISHTDQLSFTIRYVLPTGPVERYL